MPLTRLRTFTAWSYVPVLGLAGVLLLRPWRWPPGVDPLTLSLLIGLFAGAELAVIRFRTGATTLSFAFAFVAFYLFGMSAAVWVAAVGAFLSTLVRRQPVRAAFGNLGFSAVSAAVAGWLIALAWKVPGLAGDRFWQELIVLVLFSVAFFWTNVLLRQGPIWLLHGMPTWSRWRANIKLQLTALPIGVGYGVFYLMNHPPYPPIKLFFLCSPLFIIGLMWQAWHDLSRSRRWSAFLFDMAGHLTAAQSLSSTTSTVLDGLEPVLPYDHAAVLLRMAPDPDRPDEVLRVVDVRIPGLHQIVGRVYRVRRGPIWKALRSGKPERIDDLSQEGEWFPPEPLASIRACLLVPIRIGDEVRGLIGLGSDLPSAFFPEDLQLLTVLANQFGQVIQNLEIVEQRERLAVTEERNRLARDMHDGLAQHLAGVILRVERVMRLSPAASAEFESELGEVRDSLRLSLRELRRSIYHLRPEPLEERPFLSAIRRFAQEFGHDVGIQVSFTTDGHPRRLAAGVEDALFQVLTESLSNIRKHAEARQVLVEVRFGRHRVRLTVQDDGRGFELLPAIQGARAGERVGIVGMHERVKGVHGRLVIDSNAGKGTRLEVEVPYRHSANQSGLEVV